MKHSFTFLLILFVSMSLRAQTPSDMKFVPKGNICTDVGYSYNSWKKYWEGDTLRENGNVGTVSRQKIGVGFNVGIIDRLNFMVMLPYVITNASQGTLNGQNGLQDISLNLKAKYAEWTAGPGKLKLAGNLGFSTPVSSYLVDFAPLNLGMGTTNYSYRQLVSYQLDRGYYMTAKANYTYCSNIKNIHREFYYDQNQAYYTNEVAMNDMLDWTATLGFTNEKLLGEVSFSSFNTLGGGDIITWEPGFPTNNMDYSTISGRFDYFLSKPAGLGFTCGVGYCVAGRNAGQAMFANIGINYLFGVWGQNKSEE